MTRFQLLFGTCLLLAVIPWGRTTAAELHERIDALLTQSDPQFVQHEAGLSSDSEFLRRVYLDFLGRIPMATEVQFFQQQTDIHKRVQTIDRLLQRPEHARHMQHVFDVTLMQRLPNKHVPVEQWQDYLYQSFQQNISWQQLTWDLLSATGAQAESRSAARFLLDRELKPELVARAIGRVFLGRDLECAQCHNHPTIEDYPQQHYYGLVSFFSRAYLFSDPKNKESSIGEKAEGTTKFTSVFTNEEATTFPRILDLPVIADPPADKEPYLAKPDKNTRGIPKYSRLQQLPEAITRADNIAYRQNIANRLWYLMMGRGLVEPLDMFHEGNAPTHPELLKLIADDLHQHQYDIRYFLKQLALTKAYQRSSLSKAGEEPEAPRYSAAHMKPLSAEQLAWSAMQATGLLETTRRATIKSFATPKKEDTSPVVADGISYEIHLETTVNKKLQEHVASFVTAFSRIDQPGEFNATANQALFLGNAPLISAWLLPADNNLTTRLVAETDSDKLAKELYLCVLSRLPSPTETEQVTRFLGEFPERTTTVQELIRALLCSAEFRFNH
ncbi:MAG: DUF1553 domain-containing protein [Pirellulaceae bacterium]